MNVCLYLFYSLHIEFTGWKTRGRKKKKKDEGHSKLTVNLFVGVCMNACMSFCPQAELGIDVLQV